MTYAWSKSAGPGTVTFANAGTGLTSATFSLEGVYDLRLTVADNRGGSSSDTVRITVAAPRRRVVVGVFTGAIATPGLDIWLDGMDSGIVQTDGAFRFDTTSRTDSHLATIRPQIDGDN